MMLCAFSDASDNGGEAAGTFGVDIFHSKPQERSVADTDACRGLEYNRTTVGDFP